MKPISTEDKKWLKNHPLFSPLSIPEFERIIPYIKLERIGPKQLIIDKNLPTEDLYIIRSGSAKLYDSANQLELSIIQFHAGDVIGEAAFLTHAARLCDVIAEEVSDVFVISSQLTREELIYNKLKGDLLSLIVERIRASNERQVRLQQEQIELLNEKLRFSRFFISVILIFSIVMVINFSLENFLKNINIYSPLFSRIYLILIAIPLVIIAKLGKQPLSTFGITIQNWRKACIKGIIIAFFVLLCIVLLKVISNWYRNLPLFYSTLYAFKAAPPWTYCFSVILQQAIRAFMQNSMDKIFMGHSNYSIFFSAYVFGLFHIHFGLIAVLLTFLVGIMFAYVYQKDRNIMGLVIVQTISGWFAFATGLI